MMNEQVRKIMTTDPKIVSPNQSVSEVAQLMATSQLNQMPVVDNGKFVGLITTYDIWKRNHNAENQVSDKVSDVMNRRVVKITPLDKVGTAAELFMDRRFKTLPVVNLKDELKGVVTSFDVLRYALKKEYKTPILYKEVLAD